MDAIEPFLRTIFASPADDLPRLVFADWLDEHDQPDWAACVRIGCERAGLPDDHPRAAELDAALAPLLAELPHAGTDRGFSPSTAIELPANDFRDAAAFRVRALVASPHWYGARALKVTDGRITDPAPLLTILTSPVTERVTELDLRGQIIDVGPSPQQVDDLSPLPFQTLFGTLRSTFVRGPDGELLAEWSEELTPDPPAGPSGDADTFALASETEQRPVIAVRMVEVLAGTREARRLTRLDLRNNDLDNDALRALARSPYLHQLTHLDLSEGNRFKGRQWQQVLATFGDDVVR